MPPYAVSAALKHSGRKSLYTAARVGGAVFGNFSRHAALKYSHATASHDSRSTSGVE